MIGGDLDEEDFHLAEGGVAHFVNPLRQPQSRPAEKGEREGIARRLWLRNQRAGLGKLQDQRLGARGDFEILIHAGRELSAVNFSEIEHAAKANRFATD